MDQNRYMPQRRNRTHYKKYIYKLNCIIIYETYVMNFKNVTSQPSEGVYKVVSWKQHISESLLYLR